MTPNFSIRDYFIAHAPSEPQEWFKPVMSSDRPKVRFVGDDGREYTSATSAEHHCGEEGFDVLNEDQAEEWDDEYQKQRYVQWPAAWADEMIAQREAAHDAEAESNDLDRIAEMAMQAVLRRSSCRIDEREAIAEYAYSLAEAILAERKRRQQKGGAE